MVFHTLQFDQLSGFQELNHLANQLKRVYGANKAAARPFHLHFLGLKPGGRVLAKCSEKNTGFLDYSLTFDGRGVVEAFEDPSRIVYLTPDAAEELGDGLDPACVYIIGGLVDDSVQSRVSLEFAQQRGLRTARLPIQRYMRRRQIVRDDDGGCGGGGGGTLTFKQILTINQVFEILLTLYETEDWKAALRRGVPARSGFVVVDDDNS